jgi:hypothetical protein
MYTITDQNIDYILNDLKKRGIKIKSLQLSLLDHICILIEQNLEENGEFEQFYTYTIRVFYEHELGELEEEILQSLSYKNKRIMKKAMIISGAFSAAAFIGGSLAKIIQLRFTDFLLFLGFTSFVLLFLPLMFIVGIKELKTKKNIIMFASGTLSGMLYFFCMIVKCFGWHLFHPETTWLILWLIGLGIASFLFIPSYFIAGIQRPETKLNTIITSIFLVAFIGVQFRLTNLKPIRQINQHTYIRNQPLPEKSYQMTTFVSK